MGKRKIFNCPYCEIRYIGSNAKQWDEAKYQLYDHMEKEHESLLQGLSPAQVHFNYRNKKSGGSCVIDKKPTAWNEINERYERFCSDKCKETYREEFKKRMKNKYGKVHLLDDPDQQRKMLQNRSISGVYKWRNSEGETPYTGSYEREFLEFLDIFMQYPASDVMGPAPQNIPYTYKGEQKIYIPDFYLTSLGPKGTIVEIKDGGDNPNNHPGFKIDKELEKIKDLTMYDNRDKYGYIKIVDKDYSIFVNYLLKLKEA